MDANEYQRLAGRTLIDTPDVEISGHATFVAHDTIHQAAAVGIVAEYVKKGIFHQQGFDRDRFDDLNIKAGLVVDMIRRPLSDAETFAAWNVLGLCGGAGEVAALVDAMIADGQPLDTAALRKELGDVLWYVAALASKAGLELGDIMQANIDKLRTRYPEGYTAEASAARVDVAVCNCDPWIECDCTQKSEGDKTC